MITYNYYGNEQKIYYEKLPNGLDVYYLPNHLINKYQVEVVVKYGSEISEFIPVGEKSYMKIPAGTAHFLEHKMFDMEDSNAFEIFSKSGVYANAGTNYHYTKYYIEGKNNFKKNFDYLLSMVFTSYFNNAGIEKEKEIISEEIKMYDDEPEWILDRETRKCLYKKIFKEKIAGTVDSIKKINADVLTKCYNTFYQPSNIFIIVTGDIKKKDIYDVINNNHALLIRPSNIPIIYKKPKESKTVKEEYKKIYGDISFTKVNYAFKIDLSIFKDEDYSILTSYLNIFITLLFGEGSLFDEKIFNEKLATSFFYDYERVDNIYTVVFSFESEYADLVKEEIDHNLENIKIEKEDFERIKRLQEAIVIRGIDNIDFLSASMLGTIIYKHKYLDKKALFDNLQYDKLLKIIQKLDFSNKSFILMLPKI